MLKGLAISQKINVLQEQWPVELSDFVAYLKIVAEETLDDQEELERVWGKQILSVEYWIHLAKQSLEPIAGFQSDHGDDHIHAEQLFSKELCIFTSYHLSLYLGDVGISSAFESTVHSLFDLKLFAKA